MTIRKSFANLWRPWGLRVILVLAFGLRLGVCCTRSEQLEVDVDHYRGIAEQVVAGRGYADPRSGHPTAYRPPAYVGLIAIVLWLSGGAAAIGVAQSLLGAATVWLTERIACRLGLGTWSLLAAALVAVDPLLLVYTASLMTETLATFLVVLVLWLAMRDRNSSRLASLVIGVACGLACLCRPGFWFFVALLALGWLGGLLAGRRTNGRRRLAGDSWPVIAGFALSVAPWLLRNLLVIGAPILTTTHGGYTLLLANNPVYYQEVVARPFGTVWSGASLADWQRDTEARLVAELGHGADEVARDRWMSGEAWRSIVSQPGRFLQAVLLRWRMLVNVLPLGSQAMRMNPRLLLGVWIVESCLLWLSAVGLIGLACTRGAWEPMFTNRFGGPASPLEAAGFRAAPSPKWFPIVALPLSLLIVHSLYWTDTRMRAPAVPALALLACVGAATLCRIVFKSTPPGSRSPSSRY